MLVRHVPHVVRLPGMNSSRHSLGIATFPSPGMPTNCLPAVRHASQAGTPSGIVNFGYWGVALQRGESYTVSLYLRSSEVGNTVDIRLRTVARATLCLCSCAAQR